MALAVQVYALCMILSGSRKLRGAVLFVLLVLAGFELYDKLAEFFDFFASEAYEKSGWIWLITGPFVFFAFTAIGCLFAVVGPRRKPGPLWHLSRAAVSVSAALLAFGALVTIYHEWLTSAFGLTLRERAEDSLMIVSPMLIAAWLLFCAVLDMCRGREQAAETSAELDSIDSGRKMRRVIRAILGWIGALTAAGGAVAAVLASSIFLLLSGCQPPSVQSLARQFPARQKVLEQIVSMSDQDSQMEVVDPAWLEVTGKAPSTSATAVGISQSRWEEYRHLFRSAGITQGIRRYGGPKKDAFIIVKSFGILDNGYSTGYLFCAPGIEHQRQFVCNSTETHEVHQSSGGADEGYEFIKLTDRWYAYKEGPG